MLKKIKNKDTITMISVMVFTAIYVLLFIMKNVVSLDRYSKVLLLGLTIFSSFKFFPFWQQDVMKKYKSKLNMTVLVMITLISAFMIVGQPLFLTNSYIHITLKGVLYFLATSLWLFPVLFSGLYGMEWLSRYFATRKKEEDKKGSRVWITIFLLAIAIWGIILISYYPGTITSDTIDQWLQASGVRSINNAHPPFLTIVLRLFYKITPNPFLFLIFQVIGFSAIVSSFFSYLWKHGLPKMLTYFLAVLFIVAPCNYLNAVSLWKDIPYTIGLLWMSYLLMRFVVEKESFFQKKRNIFQLVVSTLITSLVRYNGIGPFLFLLIFLFGYFFYSKKKRYLFVGGLIILCYLVISKPVYNSFHIINTYGNKYSTYVNVVMRPTGLIYHNGGEVSKKTWDIMSRYASKELYRNNYNPYNIDQYTFNQEIKDYQNQLDVTISTKEVIEVFAELLVTHPGTLVKERLDGTDIMWNLTMPNGEINNRYAFGIWLPKQLTQEEKTELLKFMSEIKDDKLEYIPTNLVAAGVRKIADKMTSVYLLDNLFFRAGIWSIFFFLGFLFMMNHKKRFWIMTLPMLGTTATWIILLAFQAYRYVWYIPVCVFFYLLAVMVFPQKEKKVLK